MLLQEVNLADQGQSDIGLQVQKGERLAKLIPKGCPKGVNANEWNRKVEDWRTETARILAKMAPGLDQSFASDKGDYPHQCRIEWVRNRLEYFRATLHTANAGLGRQRQ